MPTDQGTVLIIKLPSPDLTTISGTMPVELRAELYQHPLAPVIRLVTRIHDRLANPLALETFINVEDPQQRADFAGLSRQDLLHLLFYDEMLRHHLTKSITGLDHSKLTWVLYQAVALEALIPKDKFDFDRAKAAVMASTTL